ncbi:MAG: hypothetical protein L6Q98_18340 [Anaerolineae bacterium]|nr:hypothetical protein [Anaerolineae bacterium]NUQ06881.1 hypothetical protein [Anaerolineae bacterium]
MTPDLQGYIRDIHYTPCLSQPLVRYAWDSFDINAAKGCGVVTLADGEDGLAFSKWISPKRTRSYPFARIYNTYGQNRKCVTIIPVIKDEGIAGDNDRINAITFSWMSLLNVYIILAWYDDARASTRPGKITGQRFDNDYIRQQLEAVSRYRMSALHWNVAHFERDFAALYLRAVERYQQISRRTGVPVHTEEDHLRVLEAFAPNAHLEIDLFKRLSLARSQAAALRESAVTHRLENLLDGDKGLIAISNYLGGQYFLTVDELILSDGRAIIQESKHSTRDALPKLADVQDGLFKLILFSSLDRLTLNEQPIPFSARLKLTGQLNGRLLLPADPAEIVPFAASNSLKPSERALIEGLDREARANTGLKIMIGEAEA